MTDIPIKIDAIRARRFELPDLDTHAKWVLPRLLAAYPHLNERSVLNWLRAILYNNEYMFLYTDHAVGLAQVVAGHTLAPKSVVQERFVWVENKDDKQQISDAAQFYTHFHIWATHLGADVIVVEEMSDVPHDMIKEKVGRIFIRQQQFARV